MPHLVRDGVRLYYKEAGDGEQTMLLVHGWCCDHTYMAPQLEHFDGRYRVIAVDLRGHGQSDAPRQDYSIHGFADDLEWVCEQLGIEHPVVVGHSMGGLTTLILAGERPDLLRAAILIDAPALLPADALAARRPILESFKGPDYVNAVIAYANDRFFIDADDPERRAHILEGVASMPQHVLAPAWESILTTDSTAAARRVGESGLPLLYIGAALPLADLARLRELCPHAVIGQTAGAGHFCQLEVPDQVNAMIERFLKAL